MRPPTAGPVPVAGCPFHALAQQLLDVPVHGGPSSSSPIFASRHGSLSSRSRASPRDAADFTEPTEQPSTSAASASLNSSQ